jgi:PAS domain S-box-containing protein
MSQEKEGPPIAFENVVEVLHEGYILVDEDAQIWDVNPAYCKMMGYTRSEILDMDLHDLRPGMTPEYQHEFIQEAIDAGSVEFETQHRAKDGSMVDLRASAAPIEKEGKIYLAGFVRDITKEKEAEQRLKESEQRWQRLVGDNPNGIVMIVDGMIEYINEAGAELVGERDPKTIIGASVLDYVPDKYHELVQMRMQKVYQGQKVEPFELEVLTNNGAERIIKTHPVLISYEQDDAILTVLNDITELKDKQAKLELSEQKWQYLVEENPQPVQVTVDGEIVFINDAGAELYGADTPQQLIGMSVFEFSHPSYVGKVRERKEKMENGQPVSDIHEHKIQQLGGESKYVEVSSIPIQYQGHEAIQTVLIDITERKEKEVLIAESLKEKEVLLKEIHHRVKNNMAVISGLLELQGMSAEDDKLKDLLKQSQLRISSMAMVHEKLYQTESFAGLSFDEYAQELVQTIKQTVDASTSNITVDFDTEEVSLDINQAIPAALIINEVVVNSFKHAFGSSESGRIVITVSQNGNTVNVVIKDNGVGLPSDFDIDTQNSLGVNLIQTLAGQLEAELDIRSENGTLFEMSFSKSNE